VKRLKGVPERIKIV